MNKIDEILMQLVNVAKQRVECDKQITDAVHESQPSSLLETLNSINHECRKLEDLAKELRDDLYKEVERQKYFTAVPDEG